MKYLCVNNISKSWNVAPLVGAWIEIVRGLGRTWKNTVAPLVGAWIEICCLRNSCTNIIVAPLVGAWIEIFAAELLIPDSLSRSPCGSVD